MPLRTSTNTSTPTPDLRSRARTLGRGVPTGAIPTPPQLGQVSQALRSIPDEGLSDADLNNLFARVRSQLEGGARTEIANLSSRFGGDVTNPQFQRLASLATQRAETSSASAFADVRIRESLRRAQAEETRRGQLLQAAGIQGQLSARGADIGVRRGLGLLQTSLAERGQETERQLSQAQITSRSGLQLSGITSMTGGRAGANALRRLLGLEPIGHRTRPRIPGFAGLVE